MKTEQELIARRAAKKVEISTGYEADACPPTYFAEIEELNIKCRDFTEEAAVELIQREAEIVLLQNLSMAKKILKRR